MNNKITALHSINTFMATPDNETYIMGIDSNGDSLTIIFNTIELLEWLDIDYMKNKSSIYINNL